MLITELQRCWQVNFVALGQCETSRSPLFLLFVLSYANWLLALASYCINGQKRKKESKQAYTYFPKYQTIPLRRMFEEILLLKILYVVALILILTDLYKFAFTITVHIGTHRTRPIYCISPASISSFVWLQLIQNPAV